jgi:RND family efflux transporter MFP subunit
MQETTMTAVSHLLLAARRRMRERGRWGALLAIPVAMLLLCGCDPHTSATQGTKKPKVVVTTPITDMVMDYQDFTGRIDAVKTADIRARVTGYITEVPFKEGDVVKEGDLLFQIDVRPYAADLNQAEANLKLALADRSLWAEHVKRAQVMVRTNAMSREDFDTTQASFEKATASVGSYKAARDKAQLYVDYTRVIAPWSGRISRRFVDPGNLVKADDTILTTMVTEDPMWAYFDVDERTYIDLLHQVAPGHSSWYEGLQFPVMMRLSNEKEFERVGQVNFVDNRITATTGTVRMRGVFPNPSGLLKAGLFSRVRLPIGVAYRSIIIPDEAIQSDQERKYVWVVNSSNEVEYRSVTLGQAIGALRVIRPPEKGKEGKEGLTESDRIIVSGMQRVRKGVAVEAEMQPPPAPPHMPLVRLLAEHQAGKR